MEKNPQTQTKQIRRWGVLILLTLLTIGGMLTLSYAQSTKGTAFDLSTPVSFPVDI